VAAVAAAAVTILTACGGNSPAATSTVRRHAPSVRPVAQKQPASPGPSAAAGSASPQASVTSGPRTSCTSVVHIGDSTSDGLVLADYQPDARLRIAAQYRRVGIARFIPQVSGARSIYETWHGFANGYTVAKRLIHSGYRGCWVIALGTNDAADVAVGSAMSMPARVREMMALIGNEPVMWVNVISLLSSGPYAESNMLKWNTSLLQACGQFPTMRVDDWAAFAKRSWFIPDGIHYTPQGYAHRARQIADALAAAFPVGQPAPSSQAGMERLSVADVASLGSIQDQGCLVR
jgi:hypothetical protein